MSQSFSRMGVVLIEGGVVQIIATEIPYTRTWLGMARYGMPSGLLDEEDLFCQSVCRRFMTAVVIQTGYDGQRQCKIKRCHC